jgi:hypothetical protein
VARLVGPDEGSREVRTINSAGLLKSKAGRSAVLYTDSGASSLANILTYPGGAAVSGSTVTIDAYSMLPLIQFPDGVDTLYAVVDGGPAWPIYARTDDRLDALAVADTAEAAARAAADTAEATSRAAADTAEATARAAAVAAEAAARAVADALLLRAINATDTTYGLSTGGSAAANSTALAAAFTAAAAASRPVYVPPGTYLHNGFSITTSLLGSPLSKSILHGSQITLSTSGLMLADLKLVSSSSTAVVSAHASDVKWYRVETTHDVGVTNHLAWDMFDVDRARVIDCKFGIGGLQLSGADDFFITGNYWDCNYENVNEPCHISAQSSGVFFGNTILNTTTDGVDCYSSGKRCVIVNNRFIGLRGASGLECKVVYSDDANNSSSASSLFEQTIIANNVFQNFNSSTTSTRVGIYAAYIDNRGTPAFAVEETNRGIIIANNVLADFNATDPGGGAVVSYQGIVFDGHNGMITGNVIRNMRAWNSATPVGIILFGETLDVSASPQGRRCQRARQPHRRRGGFDRRRYPRGEHGLLRDHRQHHSDRRSDRGDHEARCGGHRKRSVEPVPRRQQHLPVQQRGRVRRLDAEHGDPDRVLGQREHLQGLRGHHRQGGALGVHPQHRQ